VCLSRLPTKQSFVILLWDVILDELNIFMSLPTSEAHEGYINKQDDIN